MTVPMRLAFSMLLLGGTLACADPPGTIIIRPGGTPSVTPAVPSAPVPDRPGMIVIRPQAPGTRVLETGAVPPPAPAPAAPPTNPLPVPDPKPVTDPKPMAPPKPAEAADLEKGKILSETWEVAFIKGLKVGYSQV